MMATATSAHSRGHISSYSRPQDTLSYYHHMESPVSAQLELRVKKQRKSPPRSPPPAPPTVGPPGPPAVGPREKDELRPLQQLIISPHKVQSVTQECSYTLHRLDTSPSPSPLPPPLSDEEDIFYQSPSQLNSSKYFFPSQSNEQDVLSDADSPDISATPPLTRYSPQDDLTECSDLRRTTSATMSARITGGGLSRGGLYGALEGTMIPVTTGGHRPITRQHPSLSATIGAEILSTSLPLHEERKDLLLSPEEGPHVLGPTRPVPPPKQPTTPPLPPRHTRKLQATASSPALLTSDTTPRPRSVSFLQCDAGSDMGSFPADYLGSKEINSYTNTVNTVAKQLVNSKAMEVIAYVSSEKIRLAPPRNRALLFKSFAVRDILGVEICSKNKRIMGVLVWKRGQLPMCHILRCASSLVSASLQESLLYQTQQVDEVANGAQALSPPISETPPSASSDPGEPGDHILSPTDLLHKLPAVYVGCAGAGKLHSVSDVIDKVLCERTPSQSQAVGVWLSLSQVRLIATSDEQECAAHDTSRIRAIGVCTRDKRYMGYIIKEEGKPLTGHVLRCTSAGMMVSLVSFLRQSCQLMVFQRGGSFYDELSVDDDCDSLESNCQESKFVKHIRSLTVSLSNRTSVAPPTLTRPSFQSHTYLRKQLSPLSNDLPQKKRDAVQNPLLVSPLKYTQEDYARYTVTYVGSAALYLPFCRDSVLDALEAFAEGGVASGKAAVTKNNVEMQVSALSVSLADKSHRLFVTRNYGRKQIQGFCVHPTNSKYFAFASLRPGFPNNMKVHVFVHGEEPSSQIIDSLQYWLELAPSTS